MHLFCTVHLKSVISSVKTILNWSPYEEPRGINRVEFKVEVEVNFILMLQILPSSANETIGKENGVNYPVLYNAFAQSTQSAVTKTLYGRQDQKRWFVVNENDQSAVFFFKYLWLEAEGYVLRWFQYFVFIPELVVCK